MLALCSWTGLLRELAAKAPPSQSCTCCTYSLKSYTPALPDVCESFAQHLSALSSQLAVQWPPALMNMNLVVVVSEPENVLLLEAMLLEVHRHSRPLWTVKSGRN